LQKVLTKLKKEKEKLKKVSPLRDKNIEESENRI